jgi:hypothetical protein
MKSTLTILFISLILLTGCNIKIINKKTDCIKDKNKVYKFMDSLYIYSINDKKSKNKYSQLNTMEYNFLCISDYGKNNSCSIENFKSNYWKGLTSERLKSFKFTLTGRAIHIENKGLYIGMQSPVFIEAISKDKKYLLNSYMLKGENLIGNVKIDLNKCVKMD